MSLLYTLHYGCTCENIVEFTQFKKVVDLGNPSFYPLAFPCASYSPLPCDSLV